DTSSASSAVTYTSVYTDSEPGRVCWGADEELSDGGSPQVIVYGYDGLLMLPVAPPSPDYILGPKEPQTPPAPQDEDEHEPMFIQPPDPDFEQPLPPVVLPTAESPGYVAESDPEEDPEEYEDDETEDGPVDCPMDGGDDGNDDDGDSSGDDAHNEDEDEEEEHLALADSAVVIPTDELGSLPEGTKPMLKRDDERLERLGMVLGILGSYALSWKSCQGDSLNPPDHSLSPAKLDSTPHVHAQTTKTYQVYQGRLLKSFQDDAKYEHGGQDTRSQGGKDDQDEKDKDLKISNEKTKSKDNHKRRKIKDHQALRNKPTTLIEMKTKA
nr:hypothetical protein [Tanacetum cinerariifolium]